jgi:Galactosyltransferase
MLISFVILQMSVEKIVVLGSVSDDFDWLRNNNYLSSFVRPGILTAHHLPSNVNAQKQRDEIACFVMSAPHHRLARSAIRRTWGKVIKPLFLIGLSDDKSTMSFVMSEAKTFDDIILEDFIDSYMNLTIKTAFALKHFVMHFERSKFFLKIDDDVMLNTENLYKYLKDEDVPSDAIIGGLGSSVRPHRDRESKWYTPYWLYGESTFPAYIDGPAYLIPGESDGKLTDKKTFFCLLPSPMFAHHTFLIKKHISLPSPRCLHVRLSGHMVSRLYSTSLTLPFFTLEDVFFTGYVGRKTLNYNLHDNKRFRGRSLPYQHPCLHE